MRTVKSRVLREGDPALLRDFLRHLSLERGLSENTCLAYRSDLLQVFAHLAASKTSPEAASSEQLAEFVHGRREKGLEASSLFRKIESLRSFYRFLAAENRIDTDPTRDFASPRLPKRLPRTLDQSSIEKLLAAPVPSGYEGARARTAVELLYAAGLRASELLSLRPEQLQLDERWLRVIGKGSKERLVPLHPRAVELLKRFAAVRAAAFRGKETDGELFLSRRGRKLGRVQLWRDLKALARRAGLPGRLYPHLLRHTFATHLVQNGADLRSVQEMLGHASLSTTQVYTHLDRGDLRRRHKKHHPRG